MSDQHGDGVRQSESSGESALRSLTRRQVVAAAGLAASAALLGPGSLAFGAQPRQNPSKPASPPTGRPDPKAPATPAAPKLDLESMLTKGRTRDWVLKSFVHLDSFQDITYTTDPKAPTSPARPSVNPANAIKTIKFQTAALIYPALQATATSEATSDPTAQLRFDGRDATSEVTWLDGMQSGARYGRWDMKDKEGRTLDFDVVLPVTCWETKLDEAKAAKVPWPASGRWSKAGQSSFAPQMGIEPSSPSVHELVTKWTAGKPPQSIMPLQLAKFFAAQALEMLQPSGDGLVSSKTGLLQGFLLKNVEQTLRDGKGSEHDIACALTAIYRAAGLPARPVIGLDLTASKGEDSGLGKRGGDKLRSWVEFMLFDEASNKELWIPVDIVRMRKSSSRAPSIDRPWKFFGNNDETDDIIPIAFHYHPPTTVVAHGSPCFWGWLTMPETQVAEQTIRFVTQSAVRTPDKKRPLGK